MNDTRIRTSTRLRHRAIKILQSAQAGYDYSSIPYHRRLCTFSDAYSPTLETHLPINTDISLPRQETVNNTEIMADEARVGKIENELGGLKNEFTDMKTQMGDMSGKLDALLEVLAKKDDNTNASKDDSAHQNHPQPGATSNSVNGQPLSNQGAGAPVSNQHQAYTSRTGQQPQASASAAAPQHGHRLPHMLGAQISEEDFIQREMDRDRFHYQASGKNLYTNDPNLMSFVQTLHVRA